MSVSITAPELPGLEAAPGAPPADHLGLEEPDHRLRERVVERGPHRADGGRDARLGQAPRSWRMARHCDPRSECAISPAPFAGWRWWIACSSASSTKPAVAVRLTRPARDATGIGVDDEGCVDEAGPGGDVGEVADPQPVRRGRVELAPHAVQRAGRCRVLGRRLHGLAARAGPRNPIARISRSTVQRATATPSRPSCRQTLRTP